MKKSLLISVLTAIILVLLCLCSIMAVILYGVFKEVQVSDIARYGKLQGLLLSLSRISFQRP